MRENTLSTQVLYIYCIHTDTLVITKPTRDVDQMSVGESLARNKDV